MAYRELGEKQMALKKMVDLIAQPDDLSDIDIWISMSIIYITAVKSNVLAELMNRASKIHWKNLT